MFIVLPSATKGKICDVKCFIWEFECVIQRSIFVSLRMLKRFFVISPLDKWTKDLCASIFPLSFHLFSVKVQAKIGAKMAATSAVSLLLRGPEIRRTLLNFCLTFLLFFRCL